MTEVRAPAASTPLPRLLLLTDGRAHTSESLVEVLLRFFDDGLRGVIVRERHRPQRAREHLVARLTAGAPQGSFIALATPAPMAVAAHLRAHEQPHDMRSVEGRWGRSCHDVVDVERARATGASWATLSPFAPSLSKPGHGPAHADVAVTAVHAHARERFPVYALAGVTPTNVTDAVRWSGYGVAAHGAVWQADDPRAVMRDLVRAVDHLPPPHLSTAPTTQTRTTKEDMT